MSEIIVIGGGAAGMLAAIAASERGHHILLLEKNEKPGKKLFITGKGRCNVTNAAGPDTFFANVCTNAKFLYSAFYGYDNRAVMAFFEREGCPLKIERGERVFPVSDHSSDVIAALQRAMQRLGVEVRLGTEAAELLLRQEECGAEDMDENRVSGVKLQNGEKLSADAVIVCTGGLSYPGTGATGDGYRFAREAGHEVTRCIPSLVPLEIEEGWCSELMGLSLKNVCLSLEKDGRTLYSELGEMLFTHFGVSGPLVLTASCCLAKAESGSKKDKKAVKPEGGPARLKIDLKPALSEEQMDRRLLRDFEENQNRQFKNALGGLFPAKLIPVMVRLSGIEPDRRVNEITRKERLAFAALIKNLPLTVAGCRTFAEAIITQGGVAVRGINPSTMESKHVRGLYFAGEVLDLDARTGGFNLQIAWSTGHLAGESAARACSEEEHKKL